MNIMVNEEEKKGEVWFCCGTPKFEFKIELFMPLICINCVRFLGNIEHILGMIHECHRNIVYARGCHVQHSRML